MKNRFLGLFLCAVFGLIGGAVSNILFTNKIVAAQQVVPVLQAQRFEIIDAQGRVIGTLGPRQACLGPCLRLMDYAHQHDRNGYVDYATYDTRDLELSHGFPEGKKEVYIGYGRDEPTIDLASSAGAPGSEVGNYIHLGLGGTGEPDFPLLKMQESERQLYINVGQKPAQKPNILFFIKHDKTWDRL